MLVDLIASYCIVIDIAVVKKTHITDWRFFSSWAITPTTTKRNTKSSVVEGTNQAPLGFLLKLRYPVAWTRVPSAHQVHLHIHGFSVIFSYSTPSLLRSSPTLNDKTSRPFVLFMDCTSSASPAPVPQNMQHVYLWFCMCVRWSSTTEWAFVRLERVDIDVVVVVVVVGPSPHRKEAVQLSYISSSVWHFRFMQMSFRNIF